MPARAGGFTDPSSETDRDWSGLCHPNRRALSNSGVSPRVAEPDNGHYNYAYLYAQMICTLEAMRTTLNIDDELLQKARLLSGIQEKTALVREGLKALIERESAGRLARLGGTEPQLRPIPRRRPRTGS